MSIYVHKYVRYKKLLVMDQEPPDLFQSHAEIPLFSSSPASSFLVSNVTRFKATGFMLTTLFPLLLTFRMRGING
jgi:hypothetical protein